MRFRSRAKPPIWRSAPRRRVGMAWRSPTARTWAATPSVGRAPPAPRPRPFRPGRAVTNLAPRAPAVTASSILSVHAESGGRALLGVARGDSALGFLGLSSTPTPAFRDGLGQL